MQTVKANSRVWKANFSQAPRYRIHGVGQIRKTDGRKKTDQKNITTKHSKKY